MMPRERSKAELEDEDWDRLNYLTDTVKQEELSLLDPVTLLKRLYAEEQVRIFSPDPITFQCNCSIARCENAIRILGKEEAEAELKNKQVLVVTCEFCSKEYTFDRVDVAKIFNEGDSPPSSMQVH